MTAQPAILGLGTNLGDRLEALRRAVRAIATRDPEVRLVAISAIYQSDALLAPAAPAEWNRPFLNLAVRVESRYSPEELLTWAKALETTLGRPPNVERWAPRPIDIDLLAMLGVTRQSPRLALPHRDLTVRPFALLPAAELAPDWPVTAPSGEARTLGELAAPWRSAPDLVPLSTIRVPLSLTELVGIVNLTPDSFSDGGEWLDPRKAVEQAERLVEAGATVLDLGAESTRPGAMPISSDLEWRRLEPVLETLLDRRAARRFRVSVDTRHGTTARRAVIAGVDWINDVTGFQTDEMLEAIADFEGSVVAMHSTTIPPGPITLDPSRDPVSQLAQWAHERLERLRALGFDRDRVIIDPGIGFGKTAAQTAAILGRIGELKALGLTLLVGHSRKSFLGRWFPDLGSESGASPKDREPETAALSQILASQGVDYLRVHDVGSSARAIRVGAMLDGPIDWANAARSWTERPVERSVGSAS